MQAGSIVDPDLIHMSRHVGALLVVFCRLSSYTCPKGLEAGVQNCRVELTGVELSIRSIRNFHFTQHFTVASPQLSNALERGAIVDTTFAKPQIVVLCRGSALSIEPGPQRALPVR